MEPKHLILRAASALLFAATAHGADRDYRTAMGKRRKLVMVRSVVRL